MQVGHPPTCKGCPRTGGKEVPGLHTPPIPRLLRTGGTRERGRMRPAVRSRRKTSLIRLRRTSTPLLPLHGDTAGVFRRSPLRYCSLKAPPHRSLALPDWHRRPEAPVGIDHAKATRHRAPSRPHRWPLRIPSWVDPVGRRGFLGRHRFGTGEGCGTAYADSRRFGQIRLSQLYREDPGAAGPGEPTPRLTRRRLRVKT